MLATGARDGQIATALGITEKIVRNRVSAIPSRLQRPTGPRRADRPGSGLTGRPPDEFTPR
jgi:hypothetical protein